VTAEGNAREDFPRASKFASNCAMPGAFGLRGARVSIFVATGVLLPGAKHYDTLPTACPLTGRY